MRKLTVTKLDTSMFEQGMINLVKRVYWKYGTETAFVTGSVKLDPPKKVFKPFNELDEATVLSWIEDKVDITRHNKALDSEMFNASLDTPWSEDFEYTEPQEVTVVRQTYQYKEALDRLSRYTLAEGRPEIKEMLPTGEQVFNETTGEMEDVLHEVVTQTAIEPLEATVEVTEYPEDDPMGDPVVKTIENPEITKDNAERAEAQLVIDNTPQEIKDAN